MFIILFVLNFLTDPRLDGRFFILHSRPDRPWGTHSLLHNGYWGSFLGIKRMGCGANHPPHLASCAVLWGDIYCRVCSLIKVLKRNQLRLIVLSTHFPCKSDVRASFVFRKICCRRADQIPLNRITAMFCHFVSPSRI
jgi:hypothetical protein